MPRMLINLRQGNKPYTRRKKGKPTKSQIEIERSLARRLRAALKPTVVTDAVKAR